VLATTQSVEASELFGDPPYLFIVQFRLAQVRFYPLVIKLHGSYG